MNPELVGVDILDPFVALELQPEVEVEPEVVPEPQESATDPRTISLMFLINVSSAEWLFLLFELPVLELPFLELPVLELPFLELPKLDGL